ncbi:MAG TPA: hypothetical protein VH115_04105, partial [Solirubrobacteraceae bacterium]|nr:hypothetical protein [Solirubrobacteraceae bacterium]
MAGLMREAVSRRGSAPAKPGAPRARVVALRVGGVIVATAIVAGAALGARALANSDAANARRSFHGSSSRLAATVSLALAREEDLIVAASTFVAARPNPSSGEYATWASFAKVRARYPEVRRLDVIALVATPPIERVTPVRATLETTAPSAGAVTTTPVRESAALSERSARATAGGGASRCLLVAGLSHIAPSSSTRDLCSREPALMSTRDSGRASYASASVHGRAGLEIVTPVYRAGAAPTETAARRAMFA